MGICAENVNNLFAFLILMYVAVCACVCVWPVRVGQVAWHAYRLNLRYRLSCRLEIPIQMQRQRASILGLTCCMRGGRSGGCLASSPSSLVGHGGRLVVRLQRVVIQVSYKNRTLIYRCHRLLPLHGHIIFIFHGGVLLPPPPSSSATPTPSSSSCRVHSSSLKTFTTRSSFKRK